ncbi:MAG: cob(I)yrinic acid a,c-diamide adenosyltransferase [Phycisphaerales bacterium]|nr:cob(I)yrinic acid a,c-diamide adenosyltransferase [Phycisphaerales bacterium]
MVRLSKIYTKTGDDGSTGLGDGSRVPKTDLRVEAYGTVDEANAALGLCVIAALGHAGPHTQPIASLLTGVQNDLFDVGADLCCPVTPDEAAGSRLRVTPAQTARLERAIDGHNERLKPLDSFILPGGTPLSAALHLARTIVRRAERRTVELMEQQAETTSPETVRYLNRLSDLLFVLGRVANDDGARDVKWIPGANRTH